MLTLTLHTTNPSFTDPHAGRGEHQHHEVARGYEVARILHQAAGEISTGSRSGNLTDEHGAVVGSYVLTDAEFPQHPNT